MPPEQTGAGTLGLFGWDVHWLYFYVGATFAFVLLLRKPLGVVI